MIPLLPRAKFLFYCYYCCSDFVFMINFMVLKLNVKPKERTVLQLLLGLYLVSLKRNDLF